MLYRFIKLIDRLKRTFRAMDQDTAWPFEFQQDKWVRDAADQILSQAFEARGRTGMHLWMSLPEQAQKIVLTAWFDPYNQSLGREALEDWLHNHVFFDKYGDMVILHDYGTVLWRTLDLSLEFDPRFDIRYGKDK